MKADIHRLLILLVPLIPSVGDHDISSKSALGVAEKEDVDLEAQQPLAACSVAWEVLVSLVEGAWNEERCLLKGGSRLEFLLYNPNIYPILL